MIHRAAQLDLKSRFPCRAEFVSESVALGFFPRHGHAPFQTAGWSWFRSVSLQPPCRGRGSQLQHLLQMCRRLVLLGILAPEEGPKQEAVRSRTPWCKTAHPLSSVGRRKCGYESRGAGSRGSSHMLRWPFLRLCSRLVGCSQVTVPAPCCLRPPRPLPPQPWSFRLSQSLRVAADRG